MFGTLVMCRRGAVSSALCVGAINTCAWAGSPLLALDFESGLTGADRIVVNEPPMSVTVEDGVGLGGGRALRVRDDFSGNGPEAFWNIRPGGAPVTAQDGLGLVRISYDHKISAASTADDRLWLVATYSDASATSYQAIGTVANRGNSNGQLYQMRNVVNGSSTNVHSGSLTPWNQYRRVDYYLNLNALPPASPALPQAYGRVTTSDLSASLGFAGTTNVNSPAGVYTQREVRAVQIFSSTATAQIHYFDNLSVELIDATDVDQLLRDVKAGAYTARSDFNNSNSLNVDDANFFIETLIRTRRGDANLDRRVNFDDLLLLAASYNGSGSWSTGDFDGDQVVTFDDLLLLAANYNWNASGLAGALEGDWASAMAAVPEPAIALPVVLTAVYGLSRRRRR